MKICCRCKKEHNYYTNSYCQSCWSKLQKEYRTKLKLKDPLKVKEQNRNRSLIYQFGRSLEDYNKMLVEQNYRCAICNRERKELEKAFHIDHDHITGEVRRLLCNECNHLIGNAREDVEILKKAILYLESYKIFTNNT